MLRMEENRLIKRVVEEAMQMEKKSNWQKDLEKSSVELGWAGVKGRELDSLLMTEIRMMLRDSAWREVKWKWEVEAQEQSKLGVIQRLLVHRGNRCLCGSKIARR